MCTLNKPHLYRLFNLFNYPILASQCQQESLPSEGLLKKLYLQEVHELPPVLHLLQFPEQPVSSG